MPDDLTRFVDAQGPVYATVLTELRRGRKASHWMWFIFPQLAALGRSATARFYGIGGAAEARAYLAHPLLGPRLVECTAAVSADQGLSAEAVFGTVDAMKFRSSMSLFEAVAEDPEPFAAALERFYAGRPDETTLRLLCPDSGR